MIRRPGHRNKAEAACAAPATVKQTACRIRIRPPLTPNQPLGALKQVPGKAVEDALQARIPANEVTAPRASS